MTDNDADDSAQTLSPADWLKKARDAYASSKPHLDSQLRPQWEKNLRQWQGKHPGDSRYGLKDYGKSKLFRPRTRSVIRKNEASAAVAYLSSQDVVSIKAANDSNPLDLLTAEIAHSLLNQRLTKTIPWFLTVVGAYQTAQTYGEVVSYQYWDKEKDKPCIELIPPENFRIDPAADWLDPINSSPYIIHLLPMYAMDVKANEDFYSVTDGDLLAATGETYDSTRITRENNDSKSGSDAQSSDYMIVWVRRYIVRHGDDDYIFHTLGDNKLLSEPVPLSSLYHHGERPYVMGISIIEAFKTHPAGVPELVADVQKEINDVTNQRMDNVKLAMDKRYFVRRGVQVDLRSLTRNIAGSVTMMNDPVNDVLVHNTPDVTASSFQEQDRLNLDFDDLAGAFAGSTVQANRRLNETVGGMEMLSSGANQIAEYQLKTFNETWTEKVLRQLVKLELLYETDAALLAVAGESSQLFKQYGFQLITDEMLQGDFILNVNVGTGAANPESQVKNFFFGLQTLAGIDPAIVQNLNKEEVIKEVFGKLGYKDGKRFFNFEANPEVQALQQQIQQLQQELMNKRNPEIDAATVEKINAETTVKNVEGLFSAVQASKEFAGLTPSQILALSQMADEIYKSAGGKDYNKFPIIGNPGMQGLPIQPNPQNTHPQYPSNPQEGMMTGIDT